MRDPSQSQRSIFPDLGIHGLNQLLPPLDLFLFWFFFSFFLSVKISVCTCFLAGGVMVCVLLCSVLLHFFYFRVLFYLHFTSKSFAAWPVVFQTPPDGVLYLALLE